MVLYISISLHSRSHRSVPQRSRTGQVPLMGLKIRSSCFGFWMRFNQTPLEFASLVLSGDESALKDWSSTSPRSWFVEVVWIASWKWIFPCDYVNTSFYFETTVSSLRCLCVGKWHYRKKALSFPKSGAKCRRTPEPDNAGWEVNENANSGARPPGFILVF